MEWIKLSKGNDWGRIYYAPEGKVLTRGFASVRNGVRFPERIHVRFKDGHEDCVNVVVKQDSCTVGDHGGSYNVTSDLYGFEVEHHGASFWIDLDSVEVLKEDLELP